jgi:hypothetical protein
VPARNIARLQGRVLRTRHSRGRSRARCAARAGCSPSSSRAKIVVVDAAVGRAQRSASGCDEPATSTGATSEMNELTVTLIDKAGRKSRTSFHDALSHLDGINHHEILVEYGPECHALISGGLGGHCTLQVQHRGKLLFGGTPDDVDDDVDIGAADGEVPRNWVVPLREAAQIVQRLLDGDSPETAGLRSHDE